MKLGEAKELLSKWGYNLIKEDTDEYDDADLGLNVDPKEYHAQKSKMRSLKDRVIEAYENWVQSHYEELEKKWKNKVHKGGESDERDLMNDYQRKWKKKFQSSNKIDCIEFWKCAIAGGKSAPKGWKLGGDGDDWDDDEEDSKTSPGYGWSLVPGKQIIKAGSVAYTIYDFIDDYMMDVDGSKSEKYNTEEKFMEGAIKELTSDGSDSKDLTGYLKDHPAAFKIVKAELKKLFAFLKGKGAFSKKEIDGDDWYDYDDKFRNTLEKAFRDDYKKCLSLRPAGKKEQEKKGPEQPITPEMKKVYEEWRKKLESQVMYRSIDCDVDDDEEDLEDRIKKQDKGKHEYLKQNNRYRELSIGVVNLQNPGVSWSWDEGTDSVCGSGDRTFILVGVNDKSNIDYTLSALCYGSWPSEHEIRVLDETAVEITDVYEEGDKKIRLNRRDTYIRK